MKTVLLSILSTHLSQIVLLGSNLST